MIEYYREYRKKKWWSLEMLIHRGDGRDDVQIAHFETKRSREEYLRWLKEYLLEIRTQGR